MMEAELLKWMVPLADVISGALKVYCYAIEAELSIVRIKFFNFEVSYHHRHVLRQERVSYLADSLTLAVARVWASVSGPASPLVKCLGGPESQAQEVEPPLRGSHTPSH